MAIAHLGGGEAAPLLDRLDAERAVAVAAQDDNRRRVLPLVGVERAEEDVAWLALAPSGRELGDPEPPALHPDESIGRQDVEVVFLDRQVVARHANGHRRVALQDLVQPALAGGRQVRDDDDVHAGPVRQALQQALQRLDPACGGTDADDREGERLCHRTRGSGWRPGVSAASAAGTRPGQARAARRASACGGATRRAAGFRRQEVPA